MNLETIAEVLSGECLMTQAGPIDTVTVIAGIPTDQFLEEELVVVGEVQTISVASEVPGVTVPAGVA